MCWGSTFTIFDLLTQECPSQYHKEYGGKLTMRSISFFCESSYITPKQPPNSFYIYIISYYVGLSHCLWISPPFTDTTHNNFSYQCLQQTCIKCNTQLTSEMYVSLSYLTVSQRSTIIILDSLAIFILKNISNRNVRDLKNNK